MIEHQHKGHLIRATAHYDRDANSWTPQLIVQWEAPEGSFHDRPILFENTFPTKEQARGYALRYGIDWIDRHKPELPGSRAE
jgi:hypothetical protein